MTRPQAIGKGRRIGPYRVGDELGRGAEGLVYRAATDTGVPVALKTLLQDGPEAAAALRRDFYALSRLSHPGVPRIVAGEIDGRPPWYAMELVEGPNIVDHARSLWDVNAQAARSAPALPRIPEKVLGRLLDVTVGAFELLAYLHGEGIVHRDLKPAHLLVRADGSVAIVDFGLMSSFGAPGRERLEIAGEIAGTGSTMAPEQWRGGVVDARADLYAMGCIVHVMLTGELPFRTVSEVLDPLLLPRRLLDRVSGIPEEVDALVMRLLEKRPERRTGYAEDAARVLAALGARSPGARRPARPYIYRPRLVGRTAMLAEIEDRLDALDDGRGGLVVLEGESGAGKTRLATEAAHRAQDRGVVVLVGECPELAPGEVPQALVALRAPLRSIAARCRELGREETARLLGERARLLATYAPELADLAAAAPDPVPLSATSSRLRLLGSLADTLEALAKAAPLLLLLEDLQWADDLSLRLLDFLQAGRRLEQHPFLVVATCRSSSSPLPISGVSRATRTLDRLDTASVREIACDMIATPGAPGALLDLVAGKAEGNPFFVVEYLRTAVASGWLRRDARGTWSLPRDHAPARLPLPEAIRELVGRRLDGLPEDARRIVETACIVGREGTEDAFRLLAGMEEGRSAQAIAHLVAAQVLETAAGGRYRFVHDRVREVASLLLPDVRRRELHRAEAMRLEGLLAGARDGGPPSPTADAAAATLAHHWHQAGELSSARTCYLRAARHAVRVHALPEAEALYRSYLSLTESPSSESVTAQNDLAERVLFPLGRAEQALEVLACAHAEARSIGDRSQEVVALWVSGQILDHRGHPGEALASLEAARAAAIVLGQPTYEALVLGSLASLLRGMGRLDDARALYARALEIHRTAGSLGNEGAVLASVGSLAYDRGSLEEAKTLFEQALSLLRKAGDRCGEGLTIVNLANVELEQGHPDRAAPLYEQALAIHRAIGDRRAEGAILANMASLRKVEGRFDEAARLCEEGLAVARGSGARRIEAHLVAELAELRLHEANGDASRTLQEEALAIHRELLDLRAEGSLLVAVARRERWFGDPEAALRTAREAAEILGPIGARLDLAAAVVERGHGAIALGGDGREELRQARELASSGGADGGELRKRIDGLARAVEAAAGASPLLRGELPELLPEAVARRLAISTS